jgi:hypothetical protein
MARTKLHFIKGFEGRTLKIVLPNGHTAYLKSTSHPLLETGGVSIRMLHLSPDTGVEDVIARYEVDKSQHAWVVSEHILPGTEIYERLFLDVHISEVENEQ